MTASLQVMRDRRRLLASEKWRIPARSSGKP
jgi:hypothetical protein